MSKGGDRKRSFACLQQLAGQFPAAFLTDGPRKPLKIGIHDDLALRGVSRGVIQRGLGMYCNNGRYLAGLQEGAVRVGLDGEPAGTVTADAAAQARQLAKRLTLPAKAEQSKPKSKPQPTAPPKAKTESTPVRKAKGVGSNPAVIVEVRHKPSWKQGPKRRVIDV